MMNWQSFHATWTWEEGPKTGAQVQRLDASICRILGHEDTDNKCTLDTDTGNLYMFPMLIVLDMSVTYRYVSAHQTCKF